MNDYIILSYATISFITATDPKEFCETCIPKEKCKVFTSMNREEQVTWLLNFSCNDPRPDDFGSPPGFSSKAKGDYICCSSRIWGVENTNEFPQNGAGLSQTKYGNSNYDNNYSRGTNDLSYNTNGPYLNTRYNPPQNQWPDNDNRGYNSNRQGVSRENTNTRRWPPSNSYDGGRYWNDKPANRQWWNSRNQNSGSDQNSRNGNNNFQSKRPTFNDYQGSNRPRNRNDYDNNRPRTTTSRPFSQNPNTGNSFRKFGQCDRVTSSLPESQSGCCGREASDDDRIADPEHPPIDIRKAPLWKAPTNINKRDAPLWEFNDSIESEKKHPDDVSIDNRISGGKETELDQFPWTVYLITLFDYGYNQSAFSCGGSLISARYVLTAAHCIYDADAIVRSVEIYLAEYDKRTFPRDCKTIPGRGRECIDNILMTAENIIRHPQYSEQGLVNDIALIKLRGNAPYTDYIRPICLAPINVDEPQFSNLQLYVAGWGRDGPYRTDVKQSTVLNLVPQNRCRRFYPHLTTRHLCAAGYTGEDTCKGDSGGPLMTLYRGKYYVVGVVSGKRADSPCGTSVPSLYTNVYHYSEWIRNNARD